ncbi:hypothetical protein LEP1GSC193_3918 [Leptospira alstonii serovar Pingchang str. 80-412]|uniref:Uncharacterized protein n=2 Tax=Leptospira alstonii TaxID=28452 RepID=M6CJK1_9LEPT|nr:hypothetical protein LEP1GSC194_4135 [Leptospira alstonii serovar Sichuan str. 79601]EQA82284.1 hypothetical protein LEP1GSC193_3918 [Leptospira alstonii serovar Pingchang str. 80-412]
MLWPFESPNIQLIEYEIKKFRAFPKIQKENAGVLAFTTKHLSTFS